MTWLACRSRLRDLQRLVLVNNPSTSMREQEHRARASATASRIAASESNGSAQPILDGPQRSHIFTPFSVKYFTAPGCQGIGEFLGD
jgi:hypothetical protein